MLLKQMTVAVCVDENNGMMFGGRRQSRDRILIEAFMRAYADHSVYIGEYSRTLFADYPQVTVAAEPMKDCPDGGVCFVENMSLMPYLNQIETLVVYHWNRRYPADFYLDIQPLKTGFALISTADFEGSSHQKIIKEVYRKC